MSSPGHQTLNALSSYICKGQEGQCTCLPVSSSRSKGGVRRKEPGKRIYGHSIPQSVSIKYASMSFSLTQNQICAHHRSALHRDQGQRTDKNRHHSFSQSHRTRPCRCFMAHRRAWYSQSRFDVCWVVTLICFNFILLLFSVKTNMHWWTKERLRPFLQSWSEPCTPSACRCPKWEHEGSTIKIHTFLWKFWIQLYKVAWRWFTTRSLFSFTFSQILPISV